MSDFAPGDVVICVNTAPIERDDPITELALGRAYRIADIPWDGLVTLCSPRVPRGYLGYHDWRFRKIDAADEQFTQQMRSLKPVKVSSNV